MRETLDDLKQLQALLDRSYERAGPHLLSIHTPDRRLDAEQLAERLTGMTLLTLATITADGRPIVGPVDGIFYRGAFWFGSSPESLRARHLVERPFVSAAHVPGEHLGVTVHGTVSELALVVDIGAEFADVCVEIYGDGWRNWGSGAGYWRIDADRMFVFHMAHLDPTVETSDAASA